MCMAGNVGVTIDMSKILTPCKRWDDVLFSESHSRFITTIKPENYTNLLNISRNYNIPLSVIGSVGGNELRIMNNDDLIFSSDVNYLSDFVYSSISKIMDDGI